jgi:hypothetical protein
MKFIILFRDSKMDQAVRSGQLMHYFRPVDSIIWAWYLKFIGFI